MEDKSFPVQRTACARQRPVIVEDFVKKAIGNSKKKSYHSVLFVPVVKLSMSQGKKEGRKENDHLSDSTAGHVSARAASSLVLLVCVPREPAPGCAVRVHLGTV